MDYDSFTKIMESDEIQQRITNSCTIFEGLKIIRKYLPEKGIEGAEHDEVYSVSVDKLVSAGITEKDAKKLRALDWMIDDECECLAHFV